MDAYTYISCLNPQCSRRSYRAGRPLQAGNATSFPVVGTRATLWPGAATSGCRSTDDPTAKKKKKSRNKFESNPWWGKLPPIACLNQGPGRARVRNGGNCTNRSPQGYTYLLCVCGVTVLLCQSWRVRSQHGLSSLPPVTGLTVHASRSRSPISVSASLPSVQVPPTTHHGQSRRHHGPQCPDPVYADSACDDDAAVVLLLVPPPTPSCPSRFTNTPVTLDYGPPGRS